ncbi:MAG: SDR family oxidoreductase [Myxococcaceae bacterium]
MIVVTGATGHLGRLVIEGLKKKVPAKELVAAVRNPEKAKDLGVQVRKADYDQPETLASAFEGADTLVLISASEVGQRLRQHLAAIDAAKKAKVKRIVYTSLLHADRSGMSLAKEHFPTEQAIAKSGIPHVFLRNGWYLENYTEQLPNVLQHGAFLGSAGNGKIAAASRKDFADAIVAVVTGSGHEGKAYELAGDSAFTMSELASEVSKQAGKKVTYNDIPEQQYKATLQSFGLPENFAAMLADSDTGITRGELNDSSGDLKRLIGRPTTTLSEAIRSALKK